MKASRPAADTVAIYGRVVPVKQVPKPAMTEALNNADQVIKCQQAQITRQGRELTQSGQQLAETTAKATGLAHEVVHLRGSHDRSNEFVAFKGSLAAYKDITQDHPTIREMVDLVIQWKRMIERFAVVDYDFVAKPLKFRGSVLNITLAQGEGSRKLSYAGSPGQPERWAFYLGLLVMNRTRWNTLRVLAESENGRKFVSHVSCTLRSGKEPVVITQAPRDFVLALRS